MNSCLIYYSSASADLLYVIIKITVISAVSSVFLSITLIVLLVPWYVGNRYTNIFVLCKLETINKDVKWNSYLSNSVRREESRNPFANGLLSIFSFVI